MFKNKTKKQEYSKYVSELGKVCKIAFGKGLIDTHSGNISMGIKENILITKTGKSLIDLKPSDFTIVPLNPGKQSGKVSNPFKSAATSEPSSELEVHKFILKSFKDSTVFHSHPVNAIALSLVLDKKKTDKFKSSPLIIKKLRAEYPGLNKITPADFESAYFFPEIYIMPLKFIEDIKSGGLKLKLEAKDIFKENGVFIIKSHGSFSWGPTPLEALRWTLALEASSEIILKSLSF
jgi:L-fuculose-phosphate aldolase